MAALVLMLGTCLAGAPSPSDPIAVYQVGRSVLPASPRVETPAADSSPEPVFAPEAAAPPEVVGVASCERGRYFIARGPPAE